MKKILGLFLLLASPALAEGFAVTDLTTLTAIPDDLLGGPTISRAQPARLTLLCLECGDGSAVDVLLGRQDDGTEGRVRSGETSVAELEALCRASDPACRVEGLAAGPAVGWISSHAIGGTFGNTAVILRDGDLLTIRSVGPDPATTRRNADAVVATLAPLIIGD